MNRLTGALLFLASPLIILAVFGFWVAYTLLLSVSTIEEKLWGKS